jgi:7,8-dihydro-6-hydroxymethylpterin dimethyltransferase
MPCTCNSEGPVFLSQSRGVCRICGRMVPVRYMAYNDQVFLERLCPEHGASRALVAESLTWYLDAMQQDPMGCPPAKTIPKQAACPHGCGPCAFHAQACRLPVFSITNACNLRCPICFTYNRSDRIYHMPVDEFQRHIDFVVETTGGVDLVNITGGEPTLHPRLFDLLERARHPKIGRITLNSNGLAIAADPQIARRLAELGVYVVLSLDTLDPATSQRLHGRDITREKRVALENLARFGVQTTLLMVLVGGVNEHEIETLWSLLLTRDHVRSLTIQTMAYTGQGGARFVPRQHIPVDGVARRIAAVSNGAASAADFVPLPGAHPLCYLAAYYLWDRGEPHSFRRLLDRDTMTRHLSGGYLMQPSAELELALKQAIDRQWSQGGDDRLLAAVKQMLRRIHPKDEHLSLHERQRRVEGMVKTVYIHAHMDEDTYEIGRAMRCPDQVPVDAQRLVGACNYNLFYRQKDPRFWQPE